MKKERIYLFDNLKVLLILLVVFGHALESFLAYPAAKTLYAVIYSFHIPLFAFCSGYFAHYCPKNIRKKLIYPFLVFQFLYFLFDRFCLGNDTALTLTKPYWLMWYLLALIVWEMVLPLLETTSAGKRLALMIFFTLLGLFAGYDEKIGYYLSLSRILVYFPFFLGAYYIRQMQLLPKILAFAKSISGRIISTLFAALAVAAVFFTQGDYQISWLYGSVPYTLGNYGVLERGSLYLFSFVWILFLLGCMPNRRFFFTAIGESTMYIYLLHGFIIRYLGNELQLFNLLPYKITAALALSVLLVFLLSRKPVRKFCAPLIRLP